MLCTIDFVLLVPKNIPVGGPIFKEKALQVSNKLEVENFKVSNDWLDKFKSH